MAQFQKSIIVSKIKQILNSLWVRFLKLGSRLSLVLFY